MHRRIKSLAVRMRQHAENAFAVAEPLNSHAKIRQTYFPGLANHPQHDLAKRQMSSYSGMVNCELIGSYSDVIRFLQKLEIFYLAESLGGVESWIIRPQRMTHASVPEELRKILGIGPTLVRISVGIESADDLIADLSQALN